MGVRGVNKELQEKVLKDEARLNQLKMNHSREVSTLHINDIDAMYSELEHKPRLHENLQNLIEEYGTGPNTADNLDLINKRLEREGYMRNLD